MTFVSIEEILFVIEFKIKQFLSPSPPGDGDYRG
jgi:hypothetical protein